MVWSDIFVFDTGVEFCVAGVVDDAAKCSAHTYAVDSSKQQHNHVEHEHVQKKVDAAIDVGINGDGVLRSARRKHPSRRRQQRSPRKTARRVIVPRRKRASSCRVASVPKLLFYFSSVAVGRP